MFDGKRAVITGGSSGAGKGLAAALLARGAHVALVARDARKLLEAKEELSAHAQASHIETLSCDVADAEQVNAAFAALSSNFGPVDLLINSAGVLREGPFEQVPLEQYRQLLDINFFGVLHCVRALLPVLRERPRADIVNLASVAGLLGVYGYAPYCVSKHALVGLSETMRIELRRTNVRVHVVCPPEFDSPMVRDLEGQRSEANLAMAQMLGVLPVETVVQAVLRGVERNQFMIVPGAKARFATTMARLFPSIGRTTVDLALARKLGR